MLLRHGILKFAPFVLLALAQRDTLLFENRFLSPRLAPRGAPKSGTGTVLLFLTFFVLGAKKVAPKKQHVQVPPAGTTLSTTQKVVPARGPFVLLTLTLVRPSTTFFVPRAERPSDHDFDLLKSAT